MVFGIERRAGLPRLGLFVAINASAAIAGVLAFALWQRQQPPPESLSRLEGTITHGFHMAADDVGYIPTAGRRVTARRVADQRVLFDATYTIGPDHFRVVPPAEPEAQRCVLLFGDSHTFGEGVNDAETYAAQLAHAGRGAIAVKNFGVSGWGPHQFLAGLQSGRFAAHLPCVPTDAVYFFITDHIGRAAGRSSWDRHGPLYRLAPDGVPVRDGNFDTRGVRVPPQVKEGLLGWRRLLGVSESGTVEEASLASALIIEAARELRRRYPALGLRVINWNRSDNTRARQVLESLAAAGIPVHSIATIVPGHRDLWRSLIIDPLDPHPNAATHRRIAEYLARLLAAAPYHRG